MPIYEKVNCVALSCLPRLLDQWLPGGRYQGDEYIVKNPKRADSKAGSFLINTRTGKWADFATGERGGDVVSLSAYLFGLHQYQAAKSLALKLGVRR